MRRLGMVLSVAALALVVAPAGAGAGEDLWEPTLGGWVSGTVDYVDTVVLDTSGVTSVGAAVHDGHLYVSTSASFSIYDVSDPLAPDRRSLVPLGPHAINEVPQTNGAILLLSNDLEGVLNVWDVSDKDAPAQIGSFQSPRGDHIWTCVFDCAYAYGSHGTILDLADPTNPVEIGNWRDVAPAETFHAIKEVAPGRVLTGSEPLRYLDASDPANPVLLASGDVAKREIDSLVAHVDWPRDASDRFLLITLETPFSGQCTEESGAFFTYSTPGWQGKQTVDPIDEYQFDTNGIYITGEPPYNLIGCSPLYFDVHPDYRPEDRRVAVGWLEHGARVLGVDDDGLITELGGFIPNLGATAAPVWVTDEILYSIDFNRGIDILHVTP